MTPPELLTVNIYTDDIMDLVFYIYSFFFFSNVVGGYRHSGLASSSNLYFMGMYQIKLIHYIQQCLMAYVYLC